MPKKDGANTEMPRGAVRRLRSGDIRMGQPATCDEVAPTAEHIGSEEGTGGTETSQYPEEKKTTCDFLSSGERKGKSLNCIRVRL